MNRFITSRLLRIGAFGLVLQAPAVFAGGSHAGGHGQGDASAIGMPGQAASATRTVDVDMTDAMRFVPANVSVERGETVRFRVKNSGRLKHEFVLGTEGEIKEHYEVMKKNPEMEHADDNRVTVAPGKTGEVVWQFSQAGNVDFACLQPGHYDAGMKGMVSVADGKALSIIAQAPAGPVQGGGATAPRATPGTAATASDMTEGEVRKVDATAGKVTLKHAEIKNLDMPGMTMVFQVKDPAVLATLKAGDKVRFRAEKAGGALVVTDIRPAK